MGEVPAPPAAPKDTDMTQRLDYEAIAPKACARSAVSTAMSRNRACPLPSST